MKWKISIRDNMTCDAKISAGRNYFEKMIDRTKSPAQEKNVPQRYFFLTGGRPYDKNIKKGLHIYGVPYYKFPIGI
jgi:hypothetical protein